MMAAVHDSALDDPYSTLDERVFDLAAKKLGLAIHELLVGSDPSPDTTHPTSEQPEQFRKELEDGGASDILLEMYSRSPSEYEIQQY